MSKIQPILEHLLYFSTENIRPLEHQTLCWGLGSALGDVHATLLAVNWKSKRIVGGLFSWFRVNPVLEYICFFISYIVYRVPWDLESECWLLNILEQFFLQAVFENVKISIFDFFEKILKNKISPKTIFLRAMLLEMSLKITK